VLRPAQRLLSLPVTAQDSLADVNDVLIVVSLAWLALRVADLGFGVSQRRLAEKNPAAASTLLPLLRRLTKIVLLAIALVALFTALGFNIAGVNFYDGQGFIVPTKSNIKSAKELNGATICVQPGTTTELNLADYFRTNKMTFKPVLIEKLDELLQAYAAGRCDSYTTDASGLAAVRSVQLAGKGEHSILPERISKEPLGPIVRHGDDQWLDLVKWTLMGMIEAEEMGITSKNVDEMLKSEDPAIKRFLGVTPGYGKAVGVDEKWMYNVIKQVGNYGESYDRHVGPATALKLERGQNALWTKGGLMYAIPFR